MESWLFLALILFVGFITKNQSIVIATIFVMILKFLPHTDKLMAQFRTKGINWGVLVITIAILIPIATSEIGFKHLINAFHSPIGWVAIVSGITVSLLSARGVNLQLLWLLELSWELFSLKELLQGLLLLVVLLIVFCR